MFSHVFVGIADFDRAYPFYSALMKCLGLQERFIDDSRPWVGWQSKESVRPLFLIGAPFDNEKHVPGNGQMTAFMADSRELVDEAYRVAMSHGGTSEGEPGLRPQYHKNYYGAYFRDPEGNKLCVVCHSAKD